MAFGNEYLPSLRLRDDAETFEWILSEVERNWHEKGLGDCAVGTWTGDSKLGQLIPYADPSTAAFEVRLVEGPDFDKIALHLDRVEWVGYVGVRDATPRLPQRSVCDSPLPPWQEMIELRYGFAPEAWGKGFGTEAARAIMLWSSEQMGVLRFIAETERENVGSGSILGKLGFKQRDGNEYWKDPGEIEWERKAAKVLTL